MTFKDITLKCVECGSSFQFTAGEQEFYQSKALVNTPRRCIKCRSERKKSSRKPQKRLYDVVCSECKRAAKVPFKPSEDKPVYCKECFEKHRNIA